MPHGERMEGSVQVRALLHPLRRDVTTVPAPEGLSIAEMLGPGAAPAVHCWVGAVRIPRERWAHVRPKAGAVVTVRVLASGGDGNKVLRSVLQIAVMAAAVYVGGLGTGFLFDLAAAGIAVGGQLAINALVPPQVARLSNRAGSSFDRLRALTGTQNQFAPYSPVPRVYGRHRLYPPYAARPYTEIVGADQYLRALFCLGYGPLNTSELKIGETPIENFQDVEYEITSTPTLYTAGVVEESLTVGLDDDDFFERTTAVGVVGISVDITAPGGLYVLSGTQFRNVRVFLRVEYREVGSGPWLSVLSLPTGDVQLSGNRALVEAPLYAYNQATDENDEPWGGSPGDGWFLLEANSQQPIRTGLHWKVPVGQYEVRITRVGTFWRVASAWVDLTEGDADVLQAQTDLLLTTFRSIRPSAAAPSDAFVYLAMRIRATDQLSGLLDTVNLVAESILPVWNGASFVDQATSNPAWVYLDVACGSATERALDKSTRFDLAALLDWATECSAEGREYNAVIDAPTTVYELMRDVASVGRAGFDVPDGKFSVVRDVADPTPVQHFTPRNSWGFSGEIAFAQLPHALRVRWVNPAIGWQQDEAVVYDDGYTEANATRFELLELRGVTNRVQAWKAGRYHLAAARLRTESFRRSVDIENLACRRGDTVLQSDDVISTGLAWGRLKSVSGTTVGLDEPVTIEAGTTYGMRLRTSSATIVLRQVTTGAGSNLTQVDIASVVSGLAAGDLFVFGVMNSESMRCKVQRVEAGPDMTAVLTLVPDDDGIYTADGGSPPGLPTEPQTDPSLLLTPPLPVVYSVRSDYNVRAIADDGSRPPRIVVSFGFPSRAGLAGATVEGQYRLKAGAGAWRNTGAVPSDSGEIVFDKVIEGKDYLLRLRTVGAAGRTTEWSGAIGHTVSRSVSTPVEVIYPADVRTLYVNGRTLMWAYPSPPNTFKGFRVKYHVGINRDWSTAIYAHTGLISGPPFDMLNIPGGTVTLMIKAVDTAGLESVNPGLAVIGLGDALVENVLVTEDYAATGYPGTISGGTVNGTDLEADTTAIFWVGNDMNPFWSSDVTRLFWTADYEQLVYEFSYVPPQSTIGLDSTLTVGLGIEAIAWSLEFRLPSDVQYWSMVDNNPFWSGDSNLFWQDTVDREWMPWPGRLTNLRRVAYEFRLIAAGGAIRAVVLDLDFTVDVPDIVERFDDLVIAAAGSRVPITRTYREISNIQLTLQSDGGTAVSAKYIDKNPTLGPLVRGFNSSGTGVSSKMDITIQGY